MRENWAYEVHYEYGPVVDQRKVAIKPEKLFENDLLSRI